MKAMFVVTGVTRLILTVLLSIVLAGIGYVAMLAAFHFAGFY
jgi:hypothetical protein